MQPFMAASDNVWRSGGHVCAAASTAPPGGSGWAVLVLSLRAEAPGCLIQLQVALVGPVQWQSSSQWVSLEDQERILMETFCLVSKLDDIME